MKMSKKVLALMLALAFIIVAVCGCATGGNKSESSQSTTSAQSAQEAASTTTVAEDPFKDPIEISIAFWGIDGLTAAAPVDEAYQAFCKKLNITIKPMGVTWDDYSQKIQMWATSGQLPDIFAIDAVGTQYYHNWISQGVVKGLPQDMSKYPNMQKYLDADDINALKVDNVLYCVPRKSIPTLDWSAFDRMVLYRWDWAQAAGITKEPDTWDEFNAMLKAIVEKDPEGTKTTGLTFNNVIQISGLFWTYGNYAATSDGSGSDFKWIKEDGKFIPAVFSKKALPALKNMRYMYDQGLIDKDIALIKGEQGNDKFVAGKAAALLISGGFGAYANTIYDAKWSKVNPDKNFVQSVKVLKPLFDTNGDGNRYHCVFKTYWSESYINGQVDDKKFDRILRMMDFMVSDEGKEMLRYGIKGVDYTKDGDKITIIDESYNLGKKYTRLATIRPIVDWDGTFGYNIESPQFKDVECRKYAVDFVDWLLKNTKVPEFDPRLTTMTTPTKIKFVILDKDDLLKVMLSKEPVEKVWGDILNDYKAKGLDKMIEEVNTKAAELGIN